MDRCPVLPWRSAQISQGKEQAPMCKWQGFLGTGLPGHWALTLIVHPTHFPGLFSKRAGNRRLGEPHTAKRFHSCPHKHRPLVIKCCSKEAKAWTKSLLRVSWRGEAWDLGQQGSPKTCQGDRPWRKKWELENSLMHSSFCCSFHESYIFYITEMIFVRPSKQQKSKKW